MLFEENMHDHAHHHSHAGHRHPSDQADGAIGQPALAEGTWTCPMHPEVRRPGPGSCPKCGMALERVMPALDDRPSDELRDMTRRLWVSTALTVPVLAVAMSR